MFQKILLLFKIKDLRKKILFVLALLVVFRIAAAIPVPGIETEKLKEFFQANQFFGLLNIFSGGALSNLSIVMLGVAPYITATIIMQLLTMIFPKLKELYHESGEEGRQKFNQYSRYLTVPLAIIQAYGFLTLFQKNQLIIHSSYFIFVTDVIMVTAGSIFLMWLGELISEKGIGNGVSLIIFAGIIAGVPTGIGQTFAKDFLGGINTEKIPQYLGFLVLAVLVIAGVVFITEGQRNVPVSYAKRVRGYRVYGGVSTYLPLRVNQAGVIPIIFAISILLFPSMIANFVAAFGSPAVAEWATKFTSTFSPEGNLWLYGSAYFLLVLIFTYFYTAVTFDPKAIANNLQKQGGFIPGIRPGSQTADFLYRILNRTTLVGAIFLGTIAVMPFLMQGATGGAGAIGGTALLIVVSVVLETMKQVEAQLVMREYEGF